MSTHPLIDRLCEDFANAWSRGQEPNISEFVSRLPEMYRTQLLVRLIPIEITARQALHKPIDPDHYQHLGQEAVELFRREIERLEHQFTTEWNRTEQSKSLPATQPGGSKTFATERKVGERLKYFGEYEILEEIARGGMGIVYKARQIKLKRLVALKMILPTGLASGKEVRRFRIEAEAAAKLDHPSIVPVYETGEHDGQHYFSMGYVEGESLQAWLARGPLPAKISARIMLNITSAIAYAHEKGVIHRDLKPSNILMDQSGEPKVTDFGLAKKTDSDSGMTRSGSVMGTPSYMAPEQALGQTDNVGQCSDVYSLGAILYCMLTGRPPFQSASVVETLRQVIDQLPVNPSLLNHRIPRDLETICLKCLEKSPSRRYAGAIELAGDLERYLNSIPIRARPINPVERFTRWCMRNQALGAGVVLIALGLVGIAATGLWTARTQTNLRIASEEQKRTLEEQQAVTLKAVASLEFEQAINDFRQDEKIRGLLRLAHCLKRSVEIGDRELEQSVRFHLGAHHPNVEPPLFQYQYSTPVRAGWISSDGTKAVVITESEVSLIDLQKEPHNESLLINDPQRIKSIAVNVEGNQLLFADDSGKVKRFDIGERESTQVIVSPPSPIVALSISSNQILTMADNWEICGWDPDSGKLLFGPIVPQSPTHQASDVPDNKLLPSIIQGCWLRQIAHDSLELFKPETLHEYDMEDLAKLYPNELVLVGAALDESQDWLVTRGADGGVDVWDFSIGKKTLLVGSTYIPIPINRKLLVTKAFGKFKIEAPVADTLYHPDYSLSDRRIKSSGLTFTINRHGVAELAESTTGREIFGLLDMGGKTTVFISNPSGTILLVGDSVGNVRLLKTPPPLAGDAERILFWLYSVTGHQLADKPVDRNVLNESLISTLSRYKMRKSDTPSLTPLDINTTRIVELHLEKLGGALFPKKSVASH